MPISKSALAGCLTSGRRREVDITMKEVSETHVPCLKLLPLVPSSQPLKVRKKFNNILHIYICIYNSFATRMSQLKLWHF